MTRTQWPLDWRRRDAYVVLHGRLKYQLADDPKRLGRIIDGMDPATNQDIAIWRSLGRCS